MLKINNKEYNISDEKAAELLKDYEVKKRFVPNYGGKYYFLDDEGRILDTTWDNDAYDKNRLAIGNVYATEEEATLARDRQRALVKVNNRIIELNGEIDVDCNNIDEHFAQIYYDGDIRGFEYDISNTIFNPFIKYCASSIIASQIISELDAELKLIWGIK